MSDTIGVVIATFGNRDAWETLARKATHSALNQSQPADGVIWYHGDTLQEARNTGAERLGTDWLIFLDADDELDPLYVESMAGSSGDIRQPSTIGFYEDGTEDSRPVL